MSEVLIDFVRDVVRKHLPRHQSEFFLTGFTTAHVAAYRDFFSRAGKLFRDRNNLRCPVSFVDREYWHLNPPVVPR